MIAMNALPTCSEFVVETINMPYGSFVLTVSTSAISQAQAIIDRLKANMPCFINFKFEEINGSFKYLEATILLIPYSNTSNIIICYGFFVGAENSAGIPVLLGVSGFVSNESRLSLSIESPN